MKDYRNLEDRICYLKNKLLRSKHELKRWVYGDFWGVHLTEESEGAKLENRIAVIEYKLTHAMSDMYKLKKLINRFKGLDNRILKMKYVDGMTLEQIAEEISYSSIHIKKKHTQIVRLIKFVKREDII
ncbi:hypothetical protein [Bacillus cereus]